jgi:hypothetical protein
MFKRLLLIALCWAVAVPAAADSPVIYSGNGYARNLTSKGFQLSSGNTLNNDGAVNYAVGKASKWTAVSNVTVADDTTTNARQNTSNTGVKFTATGAGNAYFCFGLDSADYNKKLAVSFDQAPAAGYVGNDFQVDIYSTASNTCASGLTRLALSTDSSAISGLPNLTGTYRTTFDSPGSSTPYIKVQITQAANSHAITLSNFYVGPGVVTQGAALSTEIVWTPTVSGFGTVSGLTAVYSQVGEYIIGKVQFTAGTTAASLATITLPNSWTTSDGVVQGGLQFVVGRWQRLITTATAVKNGVIQTSGLSSNLLYFGKNDFTGTDNPNTHLNGSSVAGTGDIIEFEFRVRIDQLVGSGVVNVVQNDCEYAASTNGTWDAAATAANTVYGPAGAPISGSLTTDRNKIVQFLTPVQATDKLQVELQMTGANTFVAAEESKYPPVVWATSNFGPIVVGAPASNQVTVLMSQFASPGSTFNSTSGAVNWSSSTYSAWRLKKCAGGQAVGFGLATQTSAGLVGERLIGTFTGSLVSNASSTTISSITVSYTRIDDVVALSFPVITFSSNGSDATLAPGTLVLPSAIVPLTDDLRFNCPGESGGSLSASPAVIRLRNAGASSAIQIYPDGTLGTTHWASGTSGLAGICNVTYKAI